MWNRDRIAAVAVFAFAAVFAWQAEKLQNRLDIIFPRFLLIGLMGLSVLLFTLSFFKRGAEGKKGATRQKQKGKAWVGVLGTLLWVWLLPIVGFSITSVVALTSLTLVLGEQKDRTPTKALAALLVSTVIVTVIYFAFSHYLEVPLPRGRLLPS